MLDLAPLGAADPERLENALEGKARLLADGADVALVAVEEPEDGLIGRHEDGAHESQVAALATKLVSGRPGPPDGDAEFLLVHTRPVALDQVASSPSAFGHIAQSAPGGRSEASGVFLSLYGEGPYFWELGAQLGPGAHAELAVDPSQVGLDRFGAHE